MTFYKWSYFLNIEPPKFSNLQVNFKKSNYTNHASGSAMQIFSTKQNMG